MEKILDIQLEITDFCNYNCIFCNSDSRNWPHGHKRGFIDAILIEKLLLELKTHAYQFDRITFQLNWCGEPALHPKFIEIIDVFSKHCTKTFIQKIEIHTNCSTWSFTDITAFLNSINNFESDTFFQITFSLDSLEEHIYSRIRKGGKLEATMNTIETFLAIRNESGYIFPRFVYQFIPVELNRDYIGTDISALKHKTGCRKTIFKPYDRPLDSGLLEDVIYVSPCFPLTPSSIENWKFVTEQFRDSCEIQPVIEQFKSENELCRNFFQTPTISWRGEVTVCPCDELFTLSLGNLEKNSFFDIWHGQKANRIRSQIAIGDYPELCKNNCLYTSARGLSSTS